MPASCSVQPFFELRIASYFGERCVTTCMRVGLSQRKKGLLEGFALFMKAIESATNASSTVSMLYLIPAIGCGGKGPSSWIFCLPTLPHRGSTVASSVSVDQERSMLRGPTTFNNSCG